MCEDQVIDEILEGQGFGETALLHDTTRQVTARASKEVLLWAIDKYTFRDIIKDLGQTSFEDNREFIQNVEVFSMLSEDQL